MTFSISLSQSDLAYKYQVKIPNSLKYDVAKITINSEEDLDKNTIQKVCAVAVEAAVYTHIGFGIDSEIRWKQLEKKFKQLKEDNISFFIYASTLGGRGKNISFPDSYKF